MKKEIKKLQRLRDFFRQSINSTEVKDKTPLQEAKRRIEDQMVTFRDLEKEYKSKKLNKVAYQTQNEIHGKFMFDSNDSDSDSVGSSSDGASRARPNTDTLYNSDQDAQVSEDDRPRSMFAFSKQFAEDDPDSEDQPVDKEALLRQLMGDLRDQQSKHEVEVSSLRNMKKGSAKKNKDRIALIMGRITSLK